MIKSGSQVLGKCRSRLNLSRKEMLKKLNDKNDKISHMVEAAHATRPTSNERSSTKKPNPTEIVSNLSLSKDLDYHRQQLFTQKYHFDKSDTALNRRSKMDFVDLAGSTDNRTLSSLNSAKVVFNSACAF